MGRSKTFWDQLTVRQRANMLREADFEEGCARALAVLAEGPLEDPEWLKEIDLLRAKVAHLEAEFAQIEERDRQIAGLQAQIAGLKQKAATAVRGRNEALAMVVKVGGLAAVQAAQLQLDTAANFEELKPIAQAMAELGMFSILGVRFRREGCSYSLLEVLTELVQMGRRGEVAVQARMPEPRYFYLGPSTPTSLDTLYGETALEITVPAHLLHEAQRRAEFQMLALANVGKKQDKEDG